jgi:hypothetical protein
VTDSGIASVTGTSLSQTTFNTNTVGIMVDALGSITVVGTAGTGGAGTVVANGSTGAGGFDGVMFVPTTSAATFPPASSVTGLVVWDSGNNGMHIYGGANVKVRSSYVLNNGLSGIRVDTNPTGCITSLCTSNDFSEIDLGNSALSDWGLNTVQDVGAGTPNKTVGICFVPTASLATETLLADGNVFGTTNCSTTAATLSQQNDCTTKTNDDVGVATSGTVTIATDMCTY